MAEKYRLAPLDLARLTPEQRAVADAIVSGPRGGLRGPFEPWLRSPVLADRAQKLGEYCRFSSSLPKDLSELAILLTGKRYRAQFEFWAHVRLARQAGLPEDIIEAVRLGRTPRFRRESERVVYDVVTEYFTTNRVSDAAYSGRTALARRRPSAALTQHLVREHRWCARDRRRVRRARLTALSARLRLLRRE